MTNPKINPAELLLLRQYDPCHVPPEEIVVWRIQFNNIGSLGNFAMITGQPKAGKSRYLAGIMAAGISRTEILGQQVKLPEGKEKVTHFDTEQSRHDYHRMMKQIKKFCGIEENAAFENNFQSYHCRRDGPAQIIAMIRYLLQIDPGIGIVVLDGLLDMIDRFNDEGESKMLINFLKEITDVYQVLVIGVLHRSKSVDKSMGHLGSAADRAAQSVLIVEKIIEGPAITYVLKPEYLRSAETFEPVSIFYNKAVNDWQLCDTLPAAADQPGGKLRKRRPQEYDIQEHSLNVSRIFNSGGLQTYKNLIEGIKEAYGVGDTYAKQDFYQYLFREGLIFKTGEGYTNINQARLFIATKNL